MADKCLFCKGKVLQEKVNVGFRWGKDLIVIEGVPATVCRQCGEKHFDAEVYKEMEKLAKGRIKPFKRLTIDVIKFEHPVPA
jgi:YgiT-type zinc finger domain-containing protein